MNTKKPETLQMLTLALQEMVLDAGRFWEPRRIAYNLILATLALACWGSEMLSYGIGGVFAGLIVLLFFAIGANVCYCAAYAADIAFQLTPIWRYRQYARWLLFVSGTILASACALYVLLGDHMA